MEHSPSIIGTGTSTCCQAASGRSKLDTRCPRAVVVFVSLLLALHFAIAAAAELSGVSATIPPAFSLRDLSGQTRQLGDFGGEVVLINFWASWCQPCIEEIPSVQRLADALKDVPFVVVAINVGEAHRRVQAVANRLEIDFPVLLDRDNAVFKSWGATVLPAARVIDCKGEIRYQVEGPVEWDRHDIVEKLRDLATEGCSHPSTDRQLR